MTSTIPATAVDLYTSLCIKLREEARTNSGGQRANLLVAALDALEEEWPAFATLGAVQEPPVRQEADPAPGDDQAFTAWRDTFDPKHWSKNDLGACRLGWDAGREHERKSGYDDMSAEQLEELGNMLCRKAAQMTTDARPVNCHFRLHDEGKPFPKSGCDACGRTVGTGLGKQCEIRKGGEAGR